MNYLPKLHFVTGKMKLKKRKKRVEGNSDNRGCVLEGFNIHIIETFIPVCM